MINRTSSFTSRVVPKLFRVNKHLIVGGIVRSGKTMFCKKLVKTFTVCYIPVDSVVSAFQNTFPKSNIRHSGISYEARCANLAPFLFEFLDQIKYKRDFTYVVDSYHISPRDAAARVDFKSFQVLFFGYPNITVNEKYKYIKQHAKQHGCWTQTCYPVADELKRAIEISIMKSRRLQEECDKYDLTFVDTSYDFQGTIGRLVETFEKNSLIQ